MDPRELAALPPEVRTLVHAVDRYRDQHAESSPERRAELWARMHQAADDVWGRKLGWRDHLAYTAARVTWRVRWALGRPDMR